MKTKLVLVASVFAMVGAAQADCTSTVSGFYGSLGIGYGVTTAKAKKTTKAGKAEGKASGTSDKVLPFQQYNKTLDDTMRAASATGDWSSVKELSNDYDEAGIFLSNITNANDKKVADLVVKDLTVFDQLLKNLGCELTAIKDDGTTTVIDPSDVDNYAIRLNNDSKAEIMCFPYGTDNVLQLKFGNDVVMFRANPTVIEGGDTTPLAMQQSVAEYVKGLFSPVLSYVEAVGTLSDDPVSESFAATTTEVKSHRNNVRFGLNVGYQHAIGLFYTGIEISGEFTPGKVKVQTASTVKSKAHQIANTPVELRYDSEVTSGEPEITLKTKYSFGITPMFGITAGNWIFYVPVHLKMTKYDMKITPANIGTINAPTGVTAKTGYSTLKVTDLKVVADGTSTDTTAAAAAVYKKGKTKFGIEFGLGARVLLSKNVFLGLRYTYAPKTTIKISAPAYTGSKALHDLNRLGTDYKTSIESHNVSLEFGYKF